MSEPQANVTAIEKRRSTRYACVLDATVQGGARTHFWPGWPVRVLDISRHGLAMHVGEECPAGTVLTVKLYYADRKSLSPMPVRIVRATREPNGTWIVGAEFVEPLSEEQLQPLLA
jgi:hypothetical protein